MSISANWYQTGTRYGGMTTYGTDLFILTGLSQTKDQGLCQIFSTTSGLVTNVTLPSSTNPDFKDIPVYNSPNPPGAFVLRSPDNVIFEVSGATPAVTTLPVLSSNITGFLTSGTVNTLNDFYVMDHLGNLAYWDGSEWEAVSTNAIPIPTYYAADDLQPFSHLTSDSAGNLHAIAGKAQTVYLLTLSSATAGTWSIENSYGTETGFTTQNTLFDIYNNGSTTPVIVGGSANFAPSTMLVIDTATQSAYGIDSTGFQYYTGLTDNLITLPTPTQTVTLTGTPSTISVYENQVFITDSVNGTLRVLTNTGGSFSQTQSFAVSSPTSSFGLIPNGELGLLASSFNNSVYTFSVSAGTWTQTATLTGITGAYELVTVSDSSVYVAGTDGVTPLNYTTQWNIDTLISTSTPLQWIRQSSLNANIVYGAGNDSSNTFHIYAVDTTNNSIVDSYESNTTGTPAYGFLEVQGRLLIFKESTVEAVFFDGVNFYYHNTYDLIPYLSARIPVTEGFNQASCFLGGTGHYIFISGQAEPVSLLQWGQLNQSTNYAYNNNARITAYTQDPTNTYFYFFDTDNNIWKFESGTGLVSGYPQSIPPFTNQTDTYPFYLGNAIYLNNIIYLSSSSFGGITAITGL